MQFSINEIHNGSLTGETDVCIMSESAKNSHAAMPCCHSQSSNTKHDCDSSCGMETCDCSTTAMASFFIISNETIISNKIASPIFQDKLQTTIPKSPIFPIWQPPQLNSNRHTYA